MANLQTQYAGIHIPAGCEVLVGDSVESLIDLGVIPEETDSKIDITYEVSTVQGSKAETVIRQVRKMIAKGSTALYQVNLEKINSLLGGLMKITKGTGSASNTYDVKVSRTTVEDNASSTIDFIYFDFLSCYTKDNNNSSAPIKQPLNYSLLGLKIKASNQLNGIVDSLNAVCTLKARIYSGSGSGPSSWTIGEARNPSSALLYLLTDSKVNPRAVSDDMIDWPSFENFYSFCEEKEFKCDAFIANQEYTIEQLCEFIASSNLAKLSVRSNTISIITEEEIQYITQLFTPRNAANISMTKDYSSLPSILKTKFTSGDADYTEVERTIRRNSDNSISFDTEIDEDEETSEVSLFGVTNPEHAAKLIAIKLKQIHSQNRSYSWNTDIEGILCQTGDVCLLSTDSFLFGLGEAYVKSINGKKITIDSDFTMAPGKNYGIRVRKNIAGNNISSVSDPIAITTVVGTTSTITVQDATGIEVGNLISFGYINQESRKVQIKSIKVDNKKECSIEAVDYVPEVYSDDFTIPTYDPGISKYPEGTVIGGGKIEIPDKPQLPSVPGKEGIGKDAKLLVITPAQSCFTKNADGTFKESSIRVNAKIQNISGTISWTILPTNRTFTGDYIDVENSFFATGTSITITATCAGLSDTIQIGQLSDGSVGGDGRNTVLLKGTNTSVPFSLTEIAFIARSSQSFNHSKSNYEITGLKVGDIVGIPYKISDRNNIIGYLIGTITSLTSNLVVQHFSYILADKGDPGTAGSSSYIFIRYSHNSDGSNMDTNPIDTNGDYYEYMGTRITNTNNAGTHINYNWVKIKGNDGQDVLAFDVQFSSRVYQISPRNTLIADKPITVIVKTEIEGTPNITVQAGDLPPFEVIETTTNTFVFTIPRFIDGEFFNPIPITVEVELNGETKTYVIDPTVVGQDKNQFFGTTQPTTAERGEELRQGDYYATESGLIKEYNEVTKGWDDVDFTSENTERVRIASEYFVSTLQDTEEGIPDSAIAVNAYFSNLLVKSITADKLAVIKAIIDEIETKELIVGTGGKITNKSGTFLLDENGVTATNGKFIEGEFDSIHITGKSTLDGSAEFGGRIISPAVDTYIKPTYGDKFLFNNGVQDKYWRTNEIGLTNAIVPCNISYKGISYDKCSFGNQNTNVALTLTGNDTEKTFKADFSGNYTFTITPNYAEDYNDIPTSTFSHYSYYYTVWKGVVVGGVLDWWAIASDSATSTSKPKNTTKPALYEGVIWTEYTNIKSVYTDIDTRHYYTSSGSVNVLVNNVSKFSKTTDLSSSTFSYPIPRSYTTTIWINGGETVRIQTPKDYLLTYGHYIGSCSVKFNTTTAKFKLANGTNYAEFDDGYYKDAITITTVNGVSKSTPQKIYFKPQFLQINGVSVALSGIDKVYACNPISITYKGKDDSTAKTLSSVTSVAANYSGISFTNSSGTKIIFSTSDYYKEINLSLTSAIAQDIGMIVYHTLNVVTGGKP